MVVGLGDGRGAEGVGLDEVGTGLQVLLVDFLDDVGPGEGEQFIVALHVVGMVAEALATVVVLAQLVLLDHGAHGTVQDQDAFLEQFAQPGLDRAHGGRVPAGRGRGGRGVFLAHGLERTLRSQPSILGANGHMGHEGGRRSGCDRLMHGTDLPCPAAVLSSYEGMIHG